MANDGGLTRMLQVSKCSCETGRERYRIPMNTPIPFEHLVPLLFDNEDLNSDEEDEGTFPENVDQESPHVSDDGDDEEDPDGEIGQHSDFDDAETFELDEVLPPAANNAGDLNFEEDAIDASETDDPQLDTSDISDSEDDNHDEDQDQDEDPSDFHHRIPSISRFRINLTALSQVYNLYFVAYRNQIHISQPRSCISHRLPPKPDLVLRPKASLAGVQVGGFIDWQFPHQVNHLIVSGFGEEEILLLGYDDGDVIGYFTRHIEDEIERRSHLASSVPHVHGVKPFFHENVGKSAWGLAVHKQSRIIAVGSNAHAATVFIPALTGYLYSSLPGMDSRDMYRKLVKDENGNPASAAGEVLAYSDVLLENLLRRRDANWKLVLETGWEGDNIPNLTFSSDENGEADKVVAIDISGNIWLMDIWTLRKPHVRVPGLHRKRPTTMPGEEGNPRGWGVIVVHESSFLPGKDFKDSLGLTESDSRMASNPAIGRWVDISRGIKNVPGNSTQHPWTRTRQQERSARREHRRLVEYEYWFGAYSEDQSLRWSGAASMPRMLSSPSRRSRHSPVDLEDLITRKRSILKPKLVLKDGSSIIRTYETDIELRSHEEGGVGIMFQHATRQVRASHGLPALRWAAERLSNNLYVPELSLVVSGSMCGRVALITLTRHENPRLDFNRGFKVEAILPTKKDEDDRLRPICPLYGVAIGLLPVACVPDRTWPPRPPRYRLMLQYYDLRVLSYEISRDPDSNVLAVM